MRWFRSNKRSGAWCALFALLAQLALSFGHVHLGAAGATTATLAVAATPSDTPDSNGAREPCGVCTLIQLVSVAAPVNAITLALPAERRAQALLAGFDRTRATSPPRRFQARAPPIA